MFEDFESNFKIKYKPVILQNKVKPIQRCLYPELLEKEKSKSKHFKNGTSK